MPATRVPRQHHPRRMSGRGMPEVGDQGDAEDELEQTRVEGDAGAEPAESASGRAFAKAMAEISSRRKMLIDPTATATATVASSDPRQRMPITTAKRRPRPDSTDTPVTPAIVEPKPMSATLNPTASRTNNVRDGDSEPRSSEVIPDEVAEERVPIAHLTVAGDALDERGDRQHVEETEDDQEHRRPDRVRTPRERSAGRGRPPRRSRSR